MRWTRTRTGRLGTSLEKRGRWHGIPFVVRGFDLRSLTPRGWVVVCVGLLVLLGTILLEELWQ